jgi:enamine deaminase RidA (YjgF/YER057c/UK114 family)
MSLTNSNSSESDIEYDMLQAKLKIAKIEYDILEYKYNKQKSKSSKQKRIDSPIISENQPSETTSFLSDIPSNVQILDNKYARVSLHNNMLFISDCVGLDVELKKAELNKEDEVIWAIESSFLLESEIREALKSLNQILSQYNCNLKSLLTLTIILKNMENAKIVQKIYESFVLQDSSYDIKSERELLSLRFIESNMPLKYDAEIVIDAIAVVDKKLM